MAFFVYVFWYNIGMTRKSLLNTSLAFVFLTAILHFIALSFYLYWTLTWFDAIVHLCGGIGVGLFSLWLGTRGGEYSLFGFSFHTFFLVLGGSLLIGLLWEFFEWSFGLTFVTSANYGIDTLSDLAMDVLGGFVALSYVTVRSGSKK